MTMIGDKLQQVRARIVTACTAAGRDPASVRLLAVSKTFPAEAVREAHAAGQRAFGENYVQEGVAKIEALADLRAELEWHCIGPLQSNKTRLVAEHFDWVHSVDRLKIAERLSEQRPAHLPPLQVCLQVNVDGGANKSGVAPRRRAGAGAGRGGFATVAAARADGDPRAGAGFRGAARAVPARGRACSTQIRGAGIDAGHAVAGHVAPTSKPRSRPAARWCASARRSSERDSTERRP